jgi:hypothetical protein
MAEDAARADKLPVAPGDFKADVPEGPAVAENG